jgi:hypothetical protein
MTRAIVLVGCAGMLAACGQWSSDPVSALSSDPQCDTGRSTVALHASGSPATAAALIPCRYGTGIRAMEPSFGFAKDGRILYQGWALRDETPGGAPPFPIVVRSADGGRTWQDVSPLGPVNSLDPVLLVDDQTGRVFSVNFTGDGQASGATLAYSDDVGDSWIVTPIGGHGFDGQSIATGPPVSSPTAGYPNLVYHCTGTTPGSSPPLTTPICSKSLDGGLTFVPTGTLPFPIMGEEDLFAVWAGNPIVAGDGTLYVPKRHDGQPQLAISHDEGLTWTHVQVADNGSSAQATRAALDPAGNVYYTWTAADHLPYVSASRDGGLTWSAPILLSPPDVREAALPRIASDAAGRVAVVYLASIDSPGTPPWYSYCNVLLSTCDMESYGDVTWDGYIALIDDLFAADPVIRTATVNPPGSPLFVGGCSAEGACMANLDFIDVHFDAAGNPWGAFVDDCIWARGFVTLFTADTPQCSDNVGEGILGTLRPAA